MSIIYCSIYANKEKLILAESTTCESFHVRIKRLLSSILSDKETLSSREIEGGHLVVALKTKKIIFMCVSKGSHSNDRIQRFLKSFIELINKQFGTLDSVIQEPLKNLCLQKQLNTNLNKLLESYDTGVYKDKAMIDEINKDLSDIKQDLSKGIRNMVNSAGDLDELLLISQNLNIQAVEYKEDAVILEKETRCFKPWMGITLIVILVIIIVYIIFSLYLCGSLTLFCERKKSVNPAEYLI